MNYLIENLNGGEPIINPTVRWTFAGFYTDKKENIVLHVEFKTPEETFSESFTCQAEAKERTNEAIDILMSALIKPYEV